MLSEVSALLVPRPPNQGLMQFNSLIQAFQVNIDQNKGINSEPKNVAFFGVGVFTHRSRINIQR